jgi:hypothetical protein
MIDNRHEKNIRRAIEQQRVRTIREKLFELTAGNRVARLHVLALAVSETEEFIMEALAAGKLHGYQHSTGTDGGFRRILRVV